MNPDNLIEILADEYVNLIIGLNKKKIQIIGYCISGLIAVEIARRLMERGLEIFDLVLIDSHPIQYQLEDELLMEITFLPSLGIEISQLGLGEISNEELYNCQNYALSAGRYKGDVYLCLLVHDGVARIFFENYFCESFNCCITYGNILYIERDSNADYR